MLSVYNEQDIEQLRRQCAIQPHRIKLFQRAFFKQAETAERAIEQLPESARSLFLQQMQFQTLTLEEWHDSKVDEATKLIFKTEDGHWIESVILRPKTGRTSLCISSQIGCACACEFCATGSMGFVRNLTKAEILDQVVLANRFVQKENRSIRNVVFMGMGEPLQKERSSRFRELLNRSFGRFGLLKKSTLKQFYPMRLNCTLTTKLLDILFVINRKHKTTT